MTDPAVSRDPATESDPIQPSPLPEVGFAPTALRPGRTGEGVAYHQWSLLDGPASGNEGAPNDGGYLLRLAGETTFTLRVSLDGPAPEGAELGYVVQGTAGPAQVEALDPSPVPVATGSTEVTLRFEPAQVGKWYRERVLVVRLSQSSSKRLHIDVANQEFRAFLRPAAAVPRLTWASASSSGGAGAQSVVAQLSEASFEDTLVHYRVAGTLDPSRQAIAPGKESGSLTIPAGATSASLDYTVGRGAQPGEQLTFTLDHPDDAALFTIGDETLHAGENLQHFTGDWNLDNGAFGVGGEWPSSPTTYVTGGLAKRSATDTAGTFVEIVPQAEVVAPDGGPIQGVVISEYHKSNQGTGYLREGFEDEYFGGGPTTLFPTRLHVRGALRIARFEGADAWRNARFFKVAFRNRIKAIEHSVVVDTQTTGVDRHGNATTTWTLGRETWGVWDTHNIGANTTFGVVEQTFTGEGRESASGRVVNTFYLCLTMEGTFEGQEELPGDLGLLLFRPVQASQQDGTARAWEDPIDARGKGLLAFWPSLEMRDDGAFSGPPPVFWHKHAKWWEPRGNAAQSSQETTAHTFTVDS